VRDSFLKLLRPGFDFQETFMKFAEDNVINRKIAALKRDKGFHSMEEDERKELMGEIAEMKREW
jgi:hypothetical protein